MTFGETATYANLPIWGKVVIIYLMIGFCTQLPGVAYGYFLRLRHFQWLFTAPLAIKIVVGLLWLVYTIPFWPTPFLRARLNIHALEMIVIGLLAGLCIINHRVIEPHLVVTVSIVIIAGVFSLLAVFSYNHKLVCSSWRE